ncbi:2-phosphosulfolactate phosphatase [Aquirufa sp.]|jgi:2-phosphosulfolactate phosphatase|uniref:2-phosphosulfolactate phosphatase n=1 Tax=Aquirufa sp. TaxID=2676249 RepID=UPI0037C0970F
MQKIDVCLSPDLIHLYDLVGKAVVVVDVFRATSCMVTAFAHGALEIIPVEDVDVCAAHREQGYLISAERNGVTPAGFDFDNSPFSYQVDRVKDAKICVTTTNGTVALRRSLSAEKVFVGAFLNISSVVRALKTWSSDVIVVCAGWKGKPNLEDTLFAGALIDELVGQYSVADDAALIAWKQYHVASSDLVTAVKHSSHVNRLLGLGIEKDISFCLERDRYDVLPYLQGDKLVL